MCKKLKIFVSFEFYLLYLKYLNSFDIYYIYICGCPCTKCFEILKYLIGNSGVYFYMLFYLLIFFFIYIVYPLFNKKCLGS